MIALADMNRDTNELPSIISDLEMNITSVEKSQYVSTFISKTDIVLGLIAVSLNSGQLLSAKREYESQLTSHRETLKDLEELGDIVTEMLDRQQVVEVCRHVIPVSLRC